MADNERRVQFLRPADIIDLLSKQSLAFLPLGPLEWHGPHLPFGVDPLRAEVAALGLAKRLGGIVLPTLYAGTERERSAEMLSNIGLSEDQYVVGMDFPANSLPSLYSKEEAFAVVLRDYLEMLVSKWKCRNIVIVNGHGGENHLAVIDRLCLEISRSTNATLISVQPMKGFPDGKWSHASREETETVMSVWPESVDLSALPPPGKPLSNTEWAIIDDLTFRGTPTPDFTVRRDEDPRCADMAAGRRCFEETIDELASYITARIHV